MSSALPKSMHTTTSQSPYPAKRSTVVAQFEGVQVENSKHVAPSSSPKSQVLSMRWRLAGALLLMSVFFQSMKPSDPYLPLYLDDIQGLDTTTVNLYVYTWFTYAQLCALIPVTLVAEFLLEYYHVVLLGVVARVISQFLLLYGSGLVAMQMCQVIFGFSSATKIVTGAFLYEMVPVHVFHHMTSYLRAANLFSNLMAGMIGWILRDRFVASWHILFYITQASMCLGLFSFLGAMKICLSESYATERPNRRRLRLSWSEIKCGIKQAYGCRTVLLWSCWWWFGWSVHELVCQYDTTLFKEIDASQMKNGVVLSVARFCSALAALLSGRSRHILDRQGPLVLVVFSSSTACVLLVASFTQHIYLAYISLITALSILEMALCSASSQVAVRVDISMRLIVLFTNTLLSLGFQTLLQLVTGPWVLGLGIREKFHAFSIVLIGVALMVTVCACGATRTGFVDSETAASSSTLNSTSGGCVTTPLQLETVNSPNQQ